MELEIRTGSYNERRYGRPWIAKVNFNTTSQGNFQFGEWVGQPGDSGLLILEVETGDIVARGQKDLRKPRNSAPEWYQLTSEGLVKCTKSEAYLKSKEVAK